MFSLKNLWSQTITVCATCPVKSIKEAVKQAAEGDSILVKKGVYKEANIKIDKGITLIGENLPTIDGQEKGEVITIGTDNVTIDGFKIINVGVSYTTDYAAVRVVNSKGFLIQNLELEKLFFGIYLQKSNDGKVLNNKVRGEAVTEFNSGNAVHLWYCKNVEVIGNDVQNVRDGIYLEFSDNITIKDNVSKNNIRYGLHFMFSNNNYVINNTFETNGAGIALMFSKFMQVENNIIQKNWGTAAYGLLLKEVNDANIKNNLFFENTVGITVEGSNRLEYTNNDFTSNGYALKVKGACYQNHVINNNFLYNSFDISYNGRINDNKFDNNFWSNYTGYDLNKNGIGDVPYRPVKLFSYIVNRTPETIILMRSLFIDIIDFSEKVSPVFTPDNLLDENPKMKRIDHDRN
ncbi:nitrous oxide reductase family maturation protein NosD [Aequorivita sp. F64183]|uniref:Nitrous oxide reductase family maturation protein NosD n=1 Tax=Aequorivita xiaoshiensis TaxID=2874476 RepID=A0A9X1R5G8_9FLAO|nr:nitrous oxide reductase family maturation protein NosD [Aequorivita xiaoshiensis]MCG2431873.1 nitrous oxide reductase family maturation protein NosD [Aequorivita xiaoshiensis]